MLVWWVRKTQLYGLSQCLGACFRKRKGCCAQFVGKHRCFMWQPLLHIKRFHAETKIYHAYPSFFFFNSTFEPPHGKTNNLHRRKQRRKLISAFVFATLIVLSLFFLNLKFQASSSFLCFYKSVCVGPVRKPHCLFFHEAAHL